jgi:hypothetical protein
LCIVAAFWLLPAYFVGCLTIVFTIGLFSERLADMTLDSRVATAAVGGFVILCGRLVSRAWKRKRAIEDEIRPVLDIQIGEPPLPGRVERFYEKDGPLDRFFERYFGWVQGTWNRITDIWDELPFIVKSLGVIVAGFAVGAVALWLGGVPFEAPTGA